MTTEVLPSERQHWYTRDGAPCYEVPCTSKEGMRPTNISDARKRDLVPSVTLILSVAAKPGLEQWKARQLLEAALTLPQLVGETLDDYAKRVVEDSKEQARKAAERGKDLHAAIEDWIRGQTSLLYESHLQEIQKHLYPFNISLTAGNAEHSFSSDLGYGGKMDYHQNSMEAAVVIDFKTKNRLDPKFKCYDEQVMQLAAYGHGIFGSRQFRALNVFVGIEDVEVRVFEHSWDDLSKAFSMFCDLLSFWKKKNGFK